MTPAGWYPDPTSPGALRWWDGVAWTEHRAPAAPPVHTQTVPPAPTPKLRPDGTVRGPSSRSSILVLLGGLAVVGISLGVLVPGFLDAVSGPRFDIPGEETLDLDTGTWVLYQRVDAVRTGGGVTFDPGFGVSVHPADVTVTGPAPVAVRGTSFGTETITRGSATYRDAVRFDVDVAGEYRIAVRSEPSLGGEVLVARPVFDLLSLWPWFVAAIAGGFVAVAGVAMWLVGASNRRVARRAGIPV